MGVVYKARDIRLDRFVAIKVLPPEKVFDSERKRRFTQEAKAASALNHPNIITIYDIDEADSVHFISMEFVAGKTLNALIPRHGMRLGEVLKYAIQMADALSKAHAAGIIHRDLKPGNIMVTNQGLVKVLDFGLAKLAETGLTTEHDATRPIKAATEEGNIVGREAASWKSMDTALAVHRLQFAFTITFHYIFPQLTMGLALLLVVLKTMALRTGDEHYSHCARFWTKIFAINFAMGVVTGIPMEFQFGTNWARFAKAAGGILGQTLAMEGVFSFFLESTYRTQRVRYCSTTGVSQ